jgi:DNA primase
LDFGYATGKIPLYDYLIDKGFEKKDIILSGIIIENENNKLYDRFFKRLIFPIFDIRDRVIAFGGRVLDDSMPKYLNSAENLIYTKGKHLYGLNFVRKSKFDNIIIVEGYMDAVSLQKNGFTNVVASLGTALTIDQARLLKKYTDNIIIAYDSDGAGQDATLRGLDILNANNLNVKVLKLDKEEIKDPDEYVNKYGPDKLKLCINKSISLVEFKVSNLEKNLNYDDIQSKINFLNNIAVILSKIDNNIERDIYVNLLSNKYKIASSAILKEIDKKLNKTDKEDSKVVFSNKYVSNVNIRKRQEQYLIALLVFSNDKIREDILNVIDENIFENVSLKNLYNKIIQLSKEYELNKIDILSKLRDEDLVKDLTDIMYIDLNNIDKDKLLKDIIKFVKKDRLNKRKFEILEIVDKTNNIEEKDILHTELSQILIELSKLK